MDKYARVALLFVSLLFSAIVYNLFLLPTALVMGGAGGIAIITNYVYEIEPSLMVLIISIACAILSMMYLDKKVTLITIVASIAYPLFIKLTSPLIGIIYFADNEMLIFTLIGGIFYGLANGLMYKTGYTNGGLPVISQILEKYFDIPIHKSSAFMNTTIVIISGFFFGWDNVMYALILIYINTIMINKVLLGVSKNKAFYIITDEDDKVRDFIVNTMEHNATIFDVKTGFANKKDNVVLTVIPSSEYYKITSGIKAIDKDAFFVVNDAYEVRGAK